MIAGIMWDWVWTGVAIWFFIGLLPLVLLASFGLIYGVTLGAAYVLDWLKGRL